jgi:two-component system, OmpR family, sensor kinase
MPRRNGRAAHRGRFAGRLYFRIWLTVLLGLALSALLAGALWRLTAFQEGPRDIKLSTEAGRPAGTARLDFRNQPGQARIELDDGRILFARWRNDGRPGLGFVFWLVMIVAAVGLAAYPVARRLTRRLEQLREGVDALGEGDLGARVPVRGHDEVASLAERFNLAAGRIEQLVDTHKTLLANASHELRSPLTRIRMAIELIDRGDGRAAREEITRNIGELDTLIEEILLASRLEARTAPDEPFAAFDLTALAAEECARSGAELDADGVIVMSGSARLLRRALRNLLENARRHGGDAAVTASLARDASAVTLAICDRGPGVAPAERERIFDPFYRPAGSAESGGGAGLGLALVRAIARKHGGDVTCEAHDGGGACFRIRLPVNDAPRA